MQIGNIFKEGKKQEFNRLLFFLLLLISSLKAQNYYWKWNNQARRAIISSNYSLAYTKPYDIYQYCPNYNNLDNYDRVTFWIEFLKILAEYESSFNPTLIYQEKFLDKDGFYVYSVGLFQLSMESANGNYNCNIKKFEDLQNPIINLNCAIKIINKLLKKDNVIRDYRVINDNLEYKGLARYWSSIRDRKKSSRMQFILSNLKICKRK